jgi:hypothetical protein
MFTRTVFGLAVLCIVSFACGGDGPTPPPPPPAPVLPTINVLPPTSGMSGETITVGLDAANATVCTPIVISGATYIDKDGCSSFRIVLGEPGMAIVSATASNSNGVANAQQKQISIIARPMLSTKDTLSVSVYSAEESDSPPQEMRMKAVWFKSGIKDSLDILMTNGAITVEVPYSLDSVRLTFEGDARYWPDTALARRGDYYHKTLQKIVKPRVWKIRSLQFLGQSVAVSPILALKPSGPIDPLSFWRLIDVAKSSGGIERKLRGVPLDQLPRKVGIFMKSPGALPEDSVFIADKVLSRINQFLGMTVFISGKRIEGDTIPTGMVAIVVSNPTTEPIGNANGDGLFDIQTGDIYKSQVILSSRYFFDNSQIGVIVHELMHNLGVGHTCAWPTTMNSSYSIFGNEECKGIGRNDLTPTDVAVFEMGVAIREMAKRKNTPFAFN